MRLILSTLTLILIILGAGFFVVMHEQVHVQIFKYYGVDSHVEYFSHFPEAVTIPEDPCPNSDCTLAHSINEAIGYQLQVIYCLIATLGFFIILIIESNYELNEKRHNGY